MINIIVYIFIGAILFTSGVFFGVYLAEKKYKIPHNKRLI
jgi:hypothetical protein